MPELQAFHFLYPAWLLALPVLAVLWWLRRSGGGQGNPWRRVVDPELLQALVQDGMQSGSRRLRHGLLAAGWVIAVIALAGPVWQKRPLPVFQLPDALVVVLDLSRSMNTPDLSPSRLVRARFKVLDLLHRRREGQTGLVVFAGDAFAVTPLTTDTATITAQLAPLNPDLMPVQGGRVERGLDQAQQLLGQAGAGSGRVLLITDGCSDRSALDAAKRLAARGYRLSVLGVGTLQGAPLPDGQGGFVHDRQGRIVTPGLDEAALKRLAAAGNGLYSRIRTDDSDLRLLLPRPAAGPDRKAIVTDQRADRWLEYAPWLLLPLALIAALAFRRGWLLSVALLSVMVMPPRMAWAAASAADGGAVPATDGHRWWADLWQRPDQRAATALAAGDAARAAQLARTPARRGAALYRKGDYAGALAQFDRAARVKDRAKRARALYNKGNALARLGRLKDALGAYDEALKQNPGLDDAKANRQLVEALLRKQQKRHKSRSDTQKKRQAGARKAPQKDQQRQGPQKQGQQRSGQKQQAGQQGAGAQKQQAQAGADQKPDQGASGRQNQPDASGSRSDAGKPESAAKAGSKGDSPPSDFRKALKAQQQAAQNADRTGRKAAAAQGEQSKGRLRHRDALEAMTGRGLSSEERMAAEQWLKRIPDDPGGLLRRKFLYQYRQRQGNSAGSDDRQDW